MLISSRRRPHAPLHRLRGVRNMGLLGAASRRMVLHLSRKQPPLSPGQWRTHRHLLTKPKASAVDVPLSFSSKAAGWGPVNWYLRMIESRPVLTKAVTAGLIFTAADLASQKVSQKSSETLDLARTSRMAIYGLLISGPSLHKWFNFLSRILPKTDIAATFKKMFFGQAVYGPLITSVFFSYNAALQGESASEIAARLMRDLLPTLINGLIYWPTCDFITFKFVPVRLQPLVSNSFSFIWTIYLTYMASLEKAETKKIMPTS